jgi:hypothetical protein
MISSKNEEQQTAQLKEQSLKKIAEFMVQIPPESEWNY